MATKQEEHQKRVEKERAKAVTPEELKKSLIYRKIGKKGGQERAQIMHEAAQHRYEPHIVTGKKKRAA